MLDNTYKGFISEMCLVLFLTILFLLINFKWNGSTLRTSSDVVIVTTVIFFLFFYIIRTIRLSIVYRSHVWLTLLNLPTIGMVLATGQTVSQDPTPTNIFTFILFVGLFALLILIMRFHKKFKVYSFTIPPERYAVLRAVMTKKERFTLIFPDRYIRYLETGDKKYLKGDE